MCKKSYYVNSLEFHRIYLYLFFPVQWTLFWDSVLQIIRSLSFFLFEQFNEFIFLFGHGDIHPKLEENYAQGNIHAHTVRKIKIE